MWVGLVFFILFSIDKDWGRCIYAPSACDHRPRLITERWSFLENVIRMGRTSHCWHRSPWIIERMLIVLKRQTKGLIKYSNTRGLIWHQSDVNLFQAKFGKKSKIKQQLFVSRQTIIKFLFQLIDVTRVKLIFFGYV